MAELTLDLLKTRHPALIHTGISRMHEPTLFKASEILDALLEIRNKTLVHLWGYDPNVSNKEHYSGRALDFMVHSDTDAGHFIADYAIANEERLGLVHILWRQRIYRGPSSTSLNPKSAWYPMADRGNSTANHMDHPHIFFDESSYIPDPSVAGRGC